MGFFGLVGMNMFNNTNSTGTQLWQMALNEGGGNPGMKHNPIYVREDNDAPKEDEVEEVKTEDKETETITMEENDVREEQVSKEPEAVSEEKSEETVTEQTSEETKE